MSVSVISPSLVGGKAHAMTPSSAMTNFGMLMTMSPFEPNSMWMVFVYAFAKASTGGAISMRTSRAASAAVPSGEGSAPLVGS